MADAAYERIGRALGCCLGARVERCQAHLSENLHFRATHPELGGLFVKLYASEEHCRREGIVLRELARRHAWVVPGVREGELPDGERWRAFPELPLRPFALDAGQCRAAGRILAELHDTAALADELPAMEPAWRMIEARLRNAERWPGPHAEAARLLERARGLLEALHTHPSSEVLLSGDFGARNLHVRADTGRAVLLDFERSVRGDPHWDLGKVWDQGMRTPAQRAAFLAGYRDAGGASWWPNPAALWATRFAAALGIFPYASRVGDTAFFEHGREKLRVLAAELPELVRQDPNSAGRRWLC